MDLKPPKGTRDLLPEETKKRQEIYQNLRETFESYGYGEVETPAFESFDLLAKKSGPDIEDEIYAFEDKGGRKLGLRFDPTVPIARIVASDPSKPKPIKYYYITRMWRYETPQKGRWREFWQTGCELIGSKEPEADVEIIKLAYDCLKKATDEEFIIKINSREVSNAIANEIGIPEEDRLEIFRAIDKLDKKTREEVKKELKEKNVKVDYFEKMLKKIKREKIPEEPLEKLRNIKRKAQERGIRNIEIDPKIIRGIDYYTGMVFETLVKGKEDAGSVCSGGRYDSLIGLYGKEEVPATGFGLGIDRLLEITEEEENYPQAEFYICPVNEESREKAVEIAYRLREEGVKTDIDLMNRGLSKQFKYIDSKNIPYALILGPKEIRDEEITLRNMETGEENKINLENLEKELKELS